MSNKEKRSQYWDHFTDNALKSFRPKKITDIRLQQIKGFVLNNDRIWQKFFLQNNIVDKTPDELLKNLPDEYEQVRVDFWTMIREQIQLQMV